MDMDDQLLQNLTLVNLNWGSLHLADVMHV